MVVCDLISCLFFMIGDEDVMIPWQMGSVEVVDVNPFDDRSSKRLIIFVRQVSVWGKLDYD